MKNKSKLSFLEYQEIYLKREEKCWGIRRISRFLGRSPSTISRFLRRKYDICPGVWKLMSPYEKAHYAWQESKKKLSLSRKRLRLKSKRIRKLVIFLLTRKYWSPETISRFLSRHKIKISAKSIYNYIKKEKTSLKEYLVFKGRARRQRVVHSRGIFRAGAPAKKSIWERPSILEGGHWEIDTIHSKKGSKSAVLTIKERRSMKAIFFQIDDKKAETVTKQLLPFFQSLPQEMCKTMTSDNGSEFEHLYKLEKVIPGFKVYYCDAYKAWQKGAVENSNGELRRFYPKGTDFSLIPEKDFMDRVNKINNKPRISLEDKSSNKVFDELLEVA